MRLKTDWRTLLPFTKANERSPSVWSITGEQWRAIFWRVYQQLNDDRLLAVAAGVVFYGLLAIFPAITAFVSLYGLFADPVTVGNHLAAIREVIPTGGYDILEQQVNRTAEGGRTQLGLATIAGLAVALWSANAGTKAIIDALNVVYGVKERRSFVKLTLVAFAFTFGAIAVLMLAVSGVVVVPIALSYLGVGFIGQFEFLRWPLMLLLVLFALSVLYRLGPNHEITRAPWFSFGALVAAVLWLAVSALLSWYLSNFSNYNAVYGSLGAVIGMMMWMWVSTIVVLLGGELDAAIAHETSGPVTDEPR
jgi:membrane protein